MCIKHQAAIFTNRVPESGRHTRPAARLVACTLCWCSCGGFFPTHSQKVWAAQRVALPRCACLCWRCPRSALPLAGHHLDGRGRGCGAAAGCTPLLRPDWPAPRGEAARVASGPRLPSRLPSLFSHSLSPSLCSPCSSTRTAPHHSRTTPTTTRRIGWHDANQLRRLDARGDRARPDGGGGRACPMLRHLAHPTGPQLRRLSLDGWLFISLQSSPVPLPVNPDFAHAELGEKRGEILPECPAPNITLGCRSHLTLLVFPVPVFHFFNFEIPNIT